MVRTPQHSFDEKGVLVAELTKCQALLLQFVVLCGSQESVELFFLVADSVLFNNNAACQVFQ